MMSPCTWILRGSTQIGFAACKAQYWHFSPAYTFCPFCGKPISAKLEMPGPDVFITLPIILPRTETT